MDETSFDIDQAQLREAAERFPAHRLTHAGGRPNSDVTYIYNCLNKMNITLF